MSGEARSTFDSNELEQRATLTQAQHLSRIEGQARDLADALKAAEAAGVGYALVLPRLMLVFREAGMMPEGFTIPGLGG